VKNPLDGSPDRLPRGCIERNESGALQQDIRSRSRGFFCEKLALNDSNLRSHPRVNAALILLNANFVGGFVK